MAFRAETFYHFKAGKDVFDCRVQIVERKHAPFLCGRGGLTEQKRRYKLQGTADMVKKTGAHSTDMQSPESVEHLCGKCTEYAADWDSTAQELWENGKRFHDTPAKGYAEKEGK